MDEVALPNIAARNYGNASLAALAARPDLCVKVIDRKGKIIAINDVGVKLLQVADGDTLCGKKWSDMWSGADRTTIEMAVSCAFMGESSTHRLQFGGEWEIDICPLLGDGNDYDTVLAISRLISADGPEICEIDNSAATAAAALEELTKFAALTAQMADWVKAGGAQAVPEDMAAMLNDLSSKCKRSVQDLRTG